MRFRILKYLFLCKCMRVCIARFLFTYGLLLKTTRVYRRIPYYFRGDKKGGLQISAYFPERIPFSNKSLIEFQNCFSLPFYTKIFEKTMVHSSVCYDNNDVYLRYFSFVQHLVCMFTIENHKNLQLSNLCVCVCVFSALHYFSSSLFSFCCCCCWDGACPSLYNPVFLIYCQCLLFQQHTGIKFDDQPYH